MVSINLYIAGKLDCYIKFPQNWQELHWKEVLLFSKIQLQNDGNINAAKAALLLKMIAYRAFIQKIKLPENWQSKIDAEQFAADGIQLIEFMFNSNELTKQPLSVIRLKTFFPAKKMIAPTDAFKSLTCGEFEDCEIHLNSFFDKPDALPLAKMAAILWRPKNTPYQSIVKGHLFVYDYEKMVSHFLKVAPYKLYAIFTWYMGCRNQLPTFFENVYENNKSSNNEKDLMAFTKCIHAGAGPKNGNRNQIRMMLMLEFFFDMEQEAIQAKKMEEAYEQAR